MHHVTIPSPESKELLVDKAGVIGAGGNSGFQALNLAVQFGATRIILVGFDMHGAAGIHWHGNHGAELNNPGNSNFINWRQAFDGAAKRLRDLSVNVVNASPDSALMTFPRMSFESAMERFGL